MDCETSSGSSFCGWLGPLPSFVDQQLDVSLRALPTSRPNASQYTTNSTQIQPMAGRDQGKVAHRRQPQHRLSIGWKRLGRRLETTGQTARSMEGDACLVCSACSTSLVSAELCSSSFRPALQRSCAVGMLFPSSTMLLCSGPLTMPA